MKTYKTNYLNIVLGVIFLVIGLLIFHYYLPENAAKSFGSISMVLSFGCLVYCRKIEFHCKNCGKYMGELKRDKCAECSTTECEVRE